MPVPYLPILTLLLAGMLPAQAPSGYPEGQATIAVLLLHFDAEVANEVFPVYRDLVRAMSESVRFVVAIPSPEFAGAARFLLASAGLEPERLSIVVASSPGMTVWARDRMVALGDRTGGMLVAPRLDRVQSDRAGDCTVSSSISREMPGLSFRTTPLLFEGGNLLFTGGPILAGFNTVVANVEDTAAREEEVATAFEELLGAPLLCLRAGGGELPHEHLDMYLTVLDRNAALLGDPSRGADYLRTLARHGLDGSLLPSFDRWTVQDQLERIAAYRSVQADLEQAGFQVERIPILHGERNGVLTWNNALLERRTEGQVAYVPTYGLPELDEAALATYRRLGFRVYPIDVSRIAPLEERCAASPTSSGGAPPRNHSPGQPDPPSPNRHPPPWDADRPRHRGGVAASAARCRGDDPAFRLLMSEPGVHRRHGIDPSRCPRSTHPLRR